MYHGYTYETIKALWNKRIKSKGFRKILNDCQIRQAEGETVFTIHCQWSRGGHSDPIASIRPDNVWELHSKGETIWERERIKKLTGAYVWSDYSGRRNYKYKVACNLNRGGQTFPFFNGIQIEMSDGGTPLRILNPVEDTKFIVPNDEVQFVKNKTAELRKFMNTMLKLGLLDDREQYLRPLSGESPPFSSITVYGLLEQSNWEINADLALKIMRMGYRHSVAPASRHWTTSGYATMPREQYDREYATRVVHAGMEQLRKQIYKQRQSREEVPASNT